MRFRKLRIAWSAMCGIACVLLIVLWVRSHWRLDSVNFSTTETKAAQSFDGVLAFFYTRKFSEPGITSHSYAEWAAALKPPSRNKMPKWYFGSIQNGIIIKCPHWFPVLFLATSAAAPWYRRIPHQFSLRTLLIATTLVAVVLGLIVWSLR
jgi:hypothetical protein